MPSTKEEFRRVVMNAFNRSEVLREYVRFHHTHLEPMNVHDVKHMDSYSMFKYGANEWSSNYTDFHYYNVYDSILSFIYVEDRMHYTDRYNKWTFGREFRYSMIPPTPSEIVARVNRSNNNSNESLVNYHGKWIHTQYPI